jgi:hypothetical protein
LALAYRRHLGDWPGAGSGKDKCRGHLLAFAGFAIHAFLPLRYRLPFFLALSLAGIALVLGVIRGYALFRAAVSPVSPWRDAGARPER